MNGGDMRALSQSPHKSSPTYRKRDIMDTVRRFCSGDRGINLNHSKANITNEKENEYLFNGWRFLIGPLCYTG